VLHGVLLDVLLDLLVSGRGFLDLVLHVGSGGFDDLAVVLECLISVFEESQLVVAIGDGSVKALDADIVTVLLEFVFSVVAGIDVISLGLDLGVLILDITAFTISIVEGTLVSSVVLRLVGDLELEADSLIVSSLDGFLGVEVVLDNLFFPSYASIKSLLVVSDLKVGFVPVVSPGDGVLINTDLESLDPGSQKPEESLPVGVRSLSDQKGKFVHDILIDSEVSGDLLVDVLEVLSLVVDALTEITSLFLGDVVGEVSVILSIVVFVSLRYDSSITIHFLKSGFVVGLGTLVD